MKKEYFKMVTICFIIFSIMSFNSSSISTQHQTKNNTPTFNPFLSDIEVDAELDWVSVYGHLLDNYQDYGRSMAIDSENNIYIVGDSRVVGSDSNMFIAKYNSSGNYQWNVTWGSNFRDYGEDIALDSEGNLYVTGYSQKDSLPNKNITIIKFNNNGDEIWNRTWGEGGFTKDIGKSIVIDSYDNVYIIGDTQSNNVSFFDVIILKYDQTGDLLFNITWNNPGDYFEESSNAFIDDDNNIFITGSTNYNSSMGDRDIFLLKFNRSGNLLFSRIWGGTGYEYGTSVAVDSKGNIYVSGQTNSIGAGEHDMCLLKYDKYGNFIYVRTWGWEKQDSCNDIGIDRYDNIYLIGGSSFLYDPHTVSPHDIVLVKYNKYGTYQWNSTWGAHLDNDISQSICLDNNHDLYILGDISHYSLSSAWNTLLLKYNLPPAPTITINKPKEDQIYGALAPTFNVSIYVSNFNKSWYTLNNGAPKYYFTGTLGIIDQTAWNLIINGPVSIQFYVTDNYNNTGSNEVIIHKDTNSPVMTIISPSDFQVFGYNSPSFEIMISDTNLDKTWYSLNNDIDKFFFSSSMGQIEQNIWDGLIDGLHTIKFYANDTLGYTSIKQVNIYKDTTNPSILITAPVPGELFGKIAPHFSIILNEPNYNFSWYTLNDGSTKYFFTGSSGTIDQEAWNLCLNGTVLIRFYVNDTVGLESNSSVFVRKDIELPDIIFEFNEFYLNTTHPEYTHKTLSIICTTADSSGISWVFLCENTQNFFENRTMISMGNGNWSYHIDISDLNWNDEFSIFFYTNDFAGNIKLYDNSSNLFNLKIYDFTKPNSLISFIPHSGINIVNISTKFSLISNDGFGSGIYQTRYRINDSNWINFNNPFTLSTFSPGFYNITYYSIDLAGNVEEVKSSIVILVEIQEQSSPSIIPGYNIFLLIGAISVMLIILMRKKKLIYFN